MYTKIAKELLKKGFEKTADQCRAKCKKLKLDYRKIKNKHNRTGEGRSNWKFFDAMDSILQHRPTTRPAVVIDTEADEDVDEPEDNEEEEDGSINQSVSSGAQDLSSGERSDISPKSSASSSSSSGSKGTFGIKGKKRIRTRDDKIEDMMKNVVSAVVDAQKESNRMYLEMEEKGMKYEAEQRREEREFQLKVMSLLCGNQHPPSYVTQPRSSSAISWV